MTSCTVCGPPGFSVRGISQARILEWVTISFSGNIPDPGIKPVSPALAGEFFTTGKLCHLGNLAIVIVNFMCQLCLFSVPGYLSNTILGVSVEVIFR